jgi:hypothetical protein
MLLDAYRQTPVEPDPLPQEVPLTVIEPELLETEDPKVTEMPRALSVPFAALPVIVTFPTPVAEI